MSGWLRKDCWLAAAAAACALLWEVAPATSRRAQRPPRRPRPVPNCRQRSAPRKSSAAWVMVRSTGRGSGAHRGGSARRLWRTGRHQSRAERRCDDVPRRQRAIARTGTQGQSKRPELYWPTRTGGRQGRSSRSCHSTAAPWCSSGWTRKWSAATAPASMSAARLRRPAHRASSAGQAQAETQAGTGAAIKTAARLSVRRSGIL